MLMTVLATSLFVTASVDSPSRYERAFETARRRELEGRTPELVFMTERQNEFSWQIVSVYRVTSRAADAYWVVRRDRHGTGGWDYDDEDDQQPSLPMPVAWADSRNCVGVVSLLEAVERIPLMPLDVFRVGTEYGADDPVLVGGARMTFWLAGATITPSIQMRGFRFLGDWWEDGAEALRPCWTATAPHVERGD